MDLGKYINDCLTEIFSTEEFAENFLIEVVITNSKFEVFLDGDDGVTLAKCRKISRLLEEKLEASESVPEKYVLEVSSPGAARPLTKWRQYRKHSP